MTRLFQPRRWADAFDGWLTAPVPGAAGRLGLYRIAFAVFYLWRSSFIDERDVADLSRAFHRPIFLAAFWPSSLPEPLLQILAAALVASLVLLMVGLQTRCATVAVLILGILLETAHARVDHSRGAIFLCAFIPLSMLPACAWGDVFSLDAALARRRGRAGVRVGDGSARYVIPGRVNHVLLVALFALAAISKLRGVWLSNPGVMGDIVKNEVLLAATWRLPVWPAAPLVEMSPLIPPLLTWGVLLFEGSFALSLLPKLRPLFVASALVFHAANALWFVVSFTPILAVYGLLMDRPAFRARPGSSEVTAPVGSRRPIGLAAASAVVALGLAVLWHRPEVRSLLNLGGHVDQRTIWYPVLVATIVWLPLTVRRAVAGGARRARSSARRVGRGLASAPGRFAYRVAVRRLQRRWPLPASIESCGNYRIAMDLVGPSAVVYSVGVGQNVRFDEALVARSGCVVHLFDPTPIALRFAAEIPDRPALLFHPWGVWVEDGPRRFYFKNADAGEHQNLSITNLFHTDESVTCPCYRLATIMSELGHTHVDLLKMDIEGAALPVLGDMLDSGIRPGQIVFELERGMTPLRAFHRDVDLLLSRLESEGYTLHFLSRPDASRYNLVFLAVGRSRAGRG